MKRNKLTNEKCRNLPQSHLIVFHIFMHVYMQIIARN